MEWLPVYLIIGAIAVAAMWHFASKSPVIGGDDE